MVVLTRSDIINGTAARQDVYIPLLKEEISLRPLTDGEYNHIEAVKKDIGKIKTDIKFDQADEIDLDETAKSAKDELKERLRRKKPGEEKQKEKATLDKSKMQMDLDLMKTEEAKFYANCLTAAYGLSNEQETFYPEDLEGMRPIGVVKQIAEAVIKISKLDEPESLKEDMADFPQSE